MIAACAASAAAGPRPSVYSAVRITFAGETFGLLGVQTSFSEIDTNTLPVAGNHWEVVSKLGSHSYLFVGTCASETYSTTDSSGTVVRHMYLNCRDMSSDYTP